MTGDAHPLDKFGEARLADIARRVWNVMEYGDRDGDGDPGYEWSADTLDMIAYEFPVGFSDPFTDGQAG